VGRDIELSLALGFMASHGPAGLAPSSTAIHKMANLPFKGRPVHSPGHGHQIPRSTLRHLGPHSGPVALFRLVNRYVGNLPAMPGVFPDYPAPVIRNTDLGTEMVTMRWGMPPPPRTGGPPVTNIRNTSSPHWRGWLKPENRCLVPVNSFAEYAPEPNPETKKKDVVWFALNVDRPLFAFDGADWRHAGAVRALRWDDALGACPAAPRPN
jgi:hypothetical protein